MLRQRITRRRALGGAALTAGTLFLNACSGSNGNNAGGKPATQRSGTPAGGAAGSSPRPAAAAATAAPKKGGTLKGAQVTDLNLNTGYPFLLLPQNNFPTYASSEPVLRYRDSLQPYLNLAERYELAPDHMSASITLRADALFQNGQPVTPEDIFFGIDLLTDPSKFNITGAFQLTPFAKMIASKQKTDARTMTFTFDQPRVNITDFFAQLPVAQFSTFDKLKAAQDIEGTGPYWIKSWTPGQSYHMDPHPKWHGSGGPYLDGIDVKIFADNDAVGLAFQAGDVDLFFMAPGNIAKQFKSQTRVAPKVGLRYLGVNVTNPLLKDPRVRQAIFYAIDRKRFVDEVGEGFGDVTVQPWPRTSPAYDPKLDAPFYDPTKAKDLLKQAGFSQSAPLQVEYNSQRDADLAPVVKDNLAAIGVNVELTPEDGNAFLAKFRNRQLKDLFLSLHAFGDLSPLTTFQQTFPFQVPDAQGNGGNVGYFASPTYLDIVNKLQSLDPLSDAAKAQYARFNQMWLDDPWMIALQPNVRVDLVSSKVQGLNNYFITISQSPDFGAIWYKP